MGKKQKFKGNVPEGAELIAENDKWMLFDRFKPTGQWTNLKLVSKEPRTRKANFWLGWNGDRFTKNSDTDVLREHNPEVIEWMVEVLS